MAEKIFDRETLLDLTVNAIPLGMLLFFTVLFLVFRPFQGGAPAIFVLQLSIVLLTFAGLLVLTYYAGKAVSLAEKEMAAETAPGQGRTEGEPIVDSSDLDDVEGNYESADAEPREQ